jgi:hypothetical protein
MTPSCQIGGWLHGGLLIQAQHEHCQFAMWVTVARRLKEREQNMRTAAMTAGFP